MKKGFTLIELLAVIIILAIVALIATPIILDVVEDARKSAGLSEANVILGGINNYCETEKIKVQMNSDYEAICKSGLSTTDVEKMVNLGNAEIIEIEYTTKLTWLKVKSNGNIYSLQDNKMVEGDLEKPVLSFANDSWETIAENVKNGIMYNVGDTKEVTLTGDWAGTYTVRIANNSTPSECSTEGFSQTACGFVVEFVDIITKHAMNSSTEENPYGTNEGGWPASEMYSFVNIDIYNSLPSDLQNVIIDTYSVSGHGSGDSSNFESTDKLYLPSAKEVWGSNPGGYDSATEETRQLDYYKNNGVTTNSYSGAIKTYQESKNSWWLRVARSSDSLSFYSVYASGDWNNFYSANYSYPGVAPAFRIDNLE